VAEYLARAPRTLVLDHHATRDPVGTRDGDLRYFDETASAAALIVAEWIAAAGVAVDAHIADALFTGIATDTGWFRFSNTDERTLRLAADLVAAGANPNRIHETLYQQDPPAKLRLVARVLSNLELHADGRLAVMKLRAADFEATGADDTMTEDLVNEAARLNNTEVTMLLTEEPEGQVRANFRSKREIDVSELARRYGGGGHVRAAGARLRGSWDSVVSRLIEETVAML
jgi:phosphoesterase RecJ-like protein